jgi:5,10-methylenetetrahydromethanopterin reductase
MIETARSARKEAGLDPASLTLTVQLPVVVHPDRDEARRLAAGGVAMMARWSVMRNQGEAIADEQVREQFLKVRSAYDMTHHGGETGTTHAAAVTTETIDRFAIAGPPDYCVERIREVLKLGFDRVLLPAPLMAGEPSRQLGLKLLLEEVIPNLR